MRVANHVQGCRASRAGDLSTVIDETASESAPLQMGFDE
jgi:hypothetical protein